MPTLLSEPGQTEQLTPTQQNRQLGVETPLGRDVLLLTAFTGYEELSRLFGFRLSMLSTRDSIDPAQIVGRLVTFWVRDWSGEPRYFNGLVREFFAGPWSRRFRHYTAEVVPSLWLLTQKTDCRTFVNKTVPQMIEAVFAEHGFRDFETRDLKGPHPTWEYCVQYRESDFNFISRLMEQEGIFYYFRHENGRHVLVLADQKAGYPWCRTREVEYSPPELGPRGEDRITAWHHGYRLVPGSWSQTDYNFETPARAEETPANLLAANEPSMVKLPGNDRCKIFDWPGEYATRNDGRQLTRLRMEEEEVAHEVASGSSTCRLFTVGAKFTLRGHESQDEQGKAYVLTSLEHSAVEPSSYYNCNGRATSVYNNSFTCIPADVTFRPERRTPKPAIHGSQTAIVVGPRGEEIWPDQHGRVLVQFFWDRRNKRTGDNCCWVRCAQTMAGKGWGSMFIPRVGQEVVVSFLEGDPDRPLVTGLVYNADQTPAYPLPQEKTKSYVKTCSSPGGDGFNEIRFEDKKGQEHEGWSGERRAPQPPARRPAERRVQRPRQSNGPVREQASPEARRSRKSSTRHCDEEEYGRRMRASYRAAGITEDIADFHGTLLAEAHRVGRTMSWERWREIHGLAHAVFDEIFQSALDEIRDRVLDATLGDLVTNLLGLLDHVSAIQMIMEDHRWNDRDRHARQEYRTERIYAWMLGVLATNLSRRTGESVGAINSRLVHQGLLYRTWEEEHYPAVERWARQSPISRPAISTAPRHLPYAR